MVKRIIKRSAAMTLLGFATTIGANAAAPQNYYSSCEGKCGASLLTSLNEKISSHTNVGYDGLWNVYKTSDVRDNGKVWDIYCTKEWTVGQQLCGNYSKVGDCINREHSVPQSWFSSAAPMKSDAFHVYPTDGKVNGQRSNNPYGECANGTTLPSNGSFQALGKLGSCTFPGYSGTVFEPVDEYKGDLARTYFYMVACYNEKISSWGGVFGTSPYPGLKDWTLELMLKWHRQDPVSQKERDRNDAIYNHQHNRNPFIDNPEMVEHIWGTAKTSPWGAGAQSNPVIYAPQNGSTLDLGVTAPGVARTMTLNVKGAALKSAVTVSVAGTGFSASTSTLAAASVCTENGAPLTVTFNSSTTGAATGTLTLTSGEAKSTVKLTADVTSGLPIYEASDVQENEFTVRWVNVDGPGVKYQLHVKCGDTYVPDYPANVNAAAETFTVTDLTSSTRYTYYITTPSGLKSEEKSVVTAGPVPSIQFLFDGDLYFNATPGVASEVAELIMDADFIPDPVVLTVEAPFQLSTDKTNWSTSVTLNPGEERFYARMLGNDLGSFSSTLTATAGEYMNDDVTLEGSITSSSGAFLEDFEAESTLAGYTGGVYAGRIVWNITGGLVGNDTRDRHAGKQGARTTKTEGADSRFEMADALPHGAGKVSFYAKAWQGESGELALEYSEDAGITWVPVKTFEVNDEAWCEYTADVNAGGEVRLRIKRLSGKRISFDDLEVTNYTISQVMEYDYHSWDAYCLDGALVVENLGGKTMNVTVSSANGAVWFAEKISTTKTLDLPAGIYLVTVDGFTRKVMVK